MPQQSTLASKLPQSLRINSNKPNQNLSFWRYTSIHIASDLGVLYCWASCDKSVQDVPNAHKKRCSSEGRNWQGIIKDAAWVFENRVGTLGHPEAAQGHDWLYDLTCLLFPDLWSVCRAPLISLQEVSSRASTLGVSLSNVLDDILPVLANSLGNPT